MSITGDLDRKLATAVQGLKLLDSDYRLRRAALETQIKNLETAQSYITPEIEAIVEKLGVILKST